MTTQPDVLPTTYIESLEQEARQLRTENLRLQMLCTTDRKSADHWREECEKLRQDLVTLEYALPKHPSRPLLFSQRRAIALKLGTTLSPSFAAIVREVERAHGIGVRHEP